MEIYYSIIVGFFFLLAVLLLIIGVSNDAVNFLNSAIGAKAGSFRLILFIAGLGVLVGATFSNGMMEVARSGIFNPEYFSFNEVMSIFLAVMLTNVLLLDLFNSMGLPTSTTVSIVFGILGAAVGVAIIKLTGDQSSVEEFSKYINFEGSVMIIAGIFLSVIIAFTIGIIIQWITRLAFSFDVSKTYKYWSGIWGGFAITAILYFLLIKGAKGSTLVTEEMLSFINEHTLRILLISFTGWTLLFQILVLFTRINILKITVLAGTFALAMAFAGNDLVNFIGVPLAGFESYKAFGDAGQVNPDGFLMKALQEPVDTSIFFLVAAGLIMVITLGFSKKARSVIDTTINLSRQDEGAERFDSSSLSRFIVRRTVEIGNGIAKLIPGAVTRYVDKRFEPEPEQQDKEKLAFDMVRASVNLVVASILIAFGTSFKLPLSTTYVTFMVAMGSSFADGAWGRDSAVFRISGVLTVIGGWFFTAFLAFIASFIMACIIFYGRLPVVLFLMALAVYLLIRSLIKHRKETEKKENEKRAVATVSQEVLAQCDLDVRKTIQKISKMVHLTISNFLKEDHKKLKQLKKEARKLSKDIKELREDIPNTLRKFTEKELVSSHHYVQVITYMTEICNSLQYIIQPAFNHIDNKYALDQNNLSQLKDLDKQMQSFFQYIQKVLSDKNSYEQEDLNDQREKMTQSINDLIYSRVKIIKKAQKGVKLNVTLIEMLSEIKNLLLNTVQLAKADIRLAEFNEYSVDEQESVMT